MDIEELIDPLKPEGDNSPFIYSRGILTSVHIADIHFGLPACTALEEYDILINQFINRIVNINFDILSIDGDFFHKKFPSSSDTIQYGLMFLEQCVNLCRLKNATLLNKDSAFGHLLSSYFVKLYGKPDLCHEFKYLNVSNLLTKLLQ